ncbi:MAG TPA: FecR domain-containing protein [Thermoanaerobaculia bacterium]
MDTVRGLAFLLLALALLVVGVFAYKTWDRKTLARRAALIITESEGLIEQVRDKDKTGVYRGELEAGIKGLDEARAQYKKSNFPEAYQSARSSHEVLASILEEVASPDAGGQARFITIQGQVEVRRGDGGAWEEARAHGQLHTGDYVRTSETGSAEINFKDGTLYTVRPNTLFIVSPSSSGTAEQAISMQYGWVDLNTASGGSQVQTPGAVAQVRQDSEAFVTFDKDANKGRFGAFRGSVALAAKGGLQREIKEQQQVVQTGDLLSPTETLPGRPEPTEPSDNLEINLDQTPSLVLAWKPVGSAPRYALQVSRSHLFGDNLINVENRTKTRATLGLRGEGTFYWRVAAWSGKDKSAGFGPWSRPLKFRVASFRGGGGERPKTPPMLELEDLKSYGSICIVRGRSDPGTRIEVNGEQVNVALDGSFTKTVQLTKEGWNFIEVRARDNWGTQTVLSRRVFVESP